MLVPYSTTNVDIWMMSPVWVVVVVQPGRPCQVEPDQEHHYLAMPAAKANIDEFGFAVLVTHLRELPSTHCPALPLGRSVLIIQQFTIIVSFLW
jgi:hypothetical protein